MIIEFFYPLLIQIYNEPIGSVALLLIAIKLFLSRR